MSAPSSTLTYDQDPPVRASLADLGGGAKENDPTYPPDPVTDPTAEEANQTAQQIAALNRVIPIATLHVTFSGGTPSISNVKAMGNNVASVNFTVTDNGVGDTSISWTSGVGGLLPPITGAPRVSLAADVEIDRVRAFYTTVLGHPAVRVKTKLGASGTDCDFVVDIL